MAHLYADPLVYDVLHGPGTREEAALVLKLMKRLAPRAEQLLEPACGSGRLLIELARRGVRACGFDLNPAMARYCNARAAQLGLAERVHAFAAKMESFRAPKGWGRGGFDGAFNLINTIRHLGSDRAMLAHFRAVSRVLSPRGVYIVGLSHSAYGLEQESEDIWVGSRDGLRVKQVIQFIPPTAHRGPWARRERAISHLTVTPRKGTPEDRTSSYWLRTYSSAQWASLVRRAGWDIVAVTDGAGKPATPHEPGYFMYTLRPADRP
jgi:SAM-dependent methyltransferase